MTMKATFSTRMGGSARRIAASLAVCLSATNLFAAAAPGESVAAPADGDYEFLVRHMPRKDRGRVGEAYLRANVALAQEARRTAPWRSQYR